MGALFRRMVFNILIDNIDDHEKNHVLLSADPWPFGRLRLAPAYDVLPTNSGPGNQEFAVGLDGRDSALSNAMSDCEQFALQRDEAAAEIRKVTAVVGRCKRHFRAYGVATADIDDLAQRIDGDGLKLQRQEFGAATFAAAPRNRHRNPFYLIVVKRASGRSSTR